MKRTSKVSKAKEKMSHQLSNSGKAIKERRFRKKEKERKRFERPLTEFLKHKYTGIYNEYKELYTKLDAAHPDVRNLVNTRTFKKWKYEHRPDLRITVSTKSNGEEADEDQVAADVLTTAARQVFDQEPDKDVIVSEAPVASDLLTTVIRETFGHDFRQEPEGEDVIVNEAPEVIVSEAPDAIVSEAPVNEVQAIIQRVDAQVDAIINELMRDEELADLVEDEDEGIELNIFDEIQGDIELFDYTLEVEGIDW